MASGHALYDPVWVIDDAGRGSFRVECDCGWERSGFDTVSSARAAAFDHSAAGADLMPEGDAPQPGPDRRRFWRR